MSGGQRWDVMSVREYTDRTGQQKTSWSRVGSGWTNKDGSINVQLDAVPMNGRLQLQVPLSKEERQAKYQDRRNANPQYSNTQRYRQPSQPQPIGQGNMFRHPQQVQQAQQGQNYPASWDDGQDDFEQYEKENPPPGPAAEGPPFR